MSSGIYCYIDKKDCSIIYIGKDSYIDKKMRDYAHHKKCEYEKQHINKVLQNNPNRYKYKVLEEGNISQKILNALEMCFIQKYNPKFNFTKGGDGLFGVNLSISHKKNISKSQNTTGFFRVYRRTSFNVKPGFVYTYLYYKDGKQKSISSVDIKQLEKKVKKLGFTWDIINQNLANKTIKESESRKKGNKTGYFRVHKRKCKLCKKGFTWVYQYCQNGKQRVIMSVDLVKLEKKVKKNNLEWRKL